MAVALPVGGVQRSDERIGSLDVLRGIALLGMFLVHFNDQSAATGATSGLEPLYQRTVALFFEERFWTMFGILFGAGFALQLRRADARGAAFVPAYVRRMLTLAGFGLFTHAVFGYHVLFEYAVWGLPLLVVRRWSARTLLLALVLSASSGSVYTVGRAMSCVAQTDEPACRARFRAETEAASEFRTANAAAQASRDYRTVFAARLRHIGWFYRQWYAFLPVNTFTLFLLGVLALRLGLFERPQDHRRLLIALSAFGVASWTAAMWLLPAAAVSPSAPLAGAVFAAYLRSGFGLVRETWLTFAYMAVVLLAVSYDRAWLGRLSWFGWTGRMALTNYVIQVALLDLAFANYALGLKLTPLQAPLAALALFGAFALASRWWLTRFRFGPCEWLWRSATRASWQPLRAAEPVAVAG